MRFSPDGQRLAVAGGVAAEMGEVQIWDVASRKETLSVTVGFNDIYGASWSPDGKLVSFGCGDGEDNSVRAIDASTGEQVLLQGAHSDWVRDTAFSVDGSHVVSVGRDMTVKLTEVATQRFIDNVTSITPGAAQGGHPGHCRPSEAESDRRRRRRWNAQGLSHLSRVCPRDRRRRQFDLRTFPHGGPRFQRSLQRDGKRIAAGSSLDGRGRSDVCKLRL